MFVLWQQCQQLFCSCQPRVRRLRPNQTALDSQKPGIQYRTLIARHRNYHHANVTIFGQLTDHPVSARRNISLAVNSPFPVPTEKNLGNKNRRLCNTRSTVARQSKSCHFCLILKQNSFVCFFFVILVDSGACLTLPAGNTRFIQAPVAFNRHNHLFFINHYCFARIYMITPTTLYRIIDERVLFTQKWIELRFAHLNSGFCCCSSLNLLALDIQFIETPNDIVLSSSSVVYWENRGDDSTCCLHSFLSAVKFAAYCANMNRRKSSGQVNLQLAFERIQHATHVCVIGILGYFVCLRALQCF